MSNEPGISSFHTLRAGDPQPLIAVTPLAVRGRAEGAELEIGPEGGPYNCLRAGDGGSSRNQLIAIHENQRGEITTSDTMGTLKTGGGKPGQGYPAVLSIDMRNAVRNSDAGQKTGADITEGGPAYTLSCHPRARPAVGYDTVVRRLTELECERLQGYPPILTWSDDMTKDEFIAALLATGMVKADPESGRVWTLRGPGGIRLKEPREIRGSDSNGYLVAKFTLGQTKRQVRLHRLMWIAANGIPSTEMAVCHRDDVKTNNRIDNLYLATPQQNSNDAKATGRYPTGDDNPATKISSQLRQTICDDYQHSDATLQDLADKYGVSKSRVHQIVRVDGWTEGQSGSARYRQLGNSLAVPVVEWIARRLIAVDAEVNP